MTVPAIDSLALLAGAPGGATSLRQVVRDLGVGGRLMADLRPDEWPVVQLAELVQSFQNGVSSRGASNGTPVTVLRLADIKNGSICLDDPRQLTLDEDTIEKYRLAPGDVLVIRVNGSADLVGRFVVCESGVGLHCDHFIRLRLNLARVSAAYLKLVGDCTATRSKIQDLFVSTAGQKTVNQTHIGSLSFPIPPLEEQHRIVAKVEELIVLCDRLEARQQHAEAAHARLVQALLDSLTQAHDADEFQACWQQLAGLLPSLFTSEESVDALIATILELAVSGRLVSASSEEGSAEQLLREVAAVKSRLVDAEGLRTTARDDVPPEEHYLPLPLGWSYARIGNLARFIDYRGRTPEKTTSGVPLITAKNVRPGFISREPREHIAAEEFDAWMTRGFPRVGDMLFTTEAPLGNVALIDIDERFALAQRVICFQLHRLDMGPYLRLALMSKPVQQQILQMATGMTATGVKASRLKELPLPIPPSGEQDRIVAKVIELLAICDQLKARIAVAREKHAQLAEALVEAAVA